MFINIEICHVSVPNSLSRLAMWTVSVGGKMEKANWENSDRGCHPMSLTQTLVKDQQRVKKVEKWEESEKCEEKSLTQGKLKIQNKSDPKWEITSKCSQDKKCMKNE